MIALTSQSGESGWYALVDPTQSESGTLPLGEREPAATRPKGVYVQRGWSKKSSPERCLDTLREGAIVVRADVAKQIVAGTSLKTVPIAVAMTNGKRVAGWVMVIVDDWIVGDEPLRGPIARRIESPRTLVATEAFAKLLSRATGNTIRPADPGDATPFIAWSNLTYPSDARARVAYARYRETRTPSLRKAVLAHPLYALATALAIDRTSKADTRTAACRHPLSAVAYAILVDKKPTPATRRAADKNVYTAHRYAYALDREISEALAKRLVKVGSWDDENVRIEREVLAALHGKTLAEPIATRELPRRPKRPIDRIADAVTDAEVRADIDEMTERGLVRIAAVHDAVPDVVDKLHRYVDTIRDGTVGKLGNKLGVVQLELACAFAEQLHRALAWQWTLIPEAVGIASPDGAYAVHLLPMFARIACKDGASNTIGLLFNMIVANNLPPRRRGKYLALT